LKKQKSKDDKEKTAGDSLTRHDTPKQEEPIPA